MRSIALAGLSFVIAAGCVVEDEASDGVESVEAAVTVTPSPAGATPVPADYNGDGFTDLALKGANGMWYLDIGVCNGDSDPQRETECNDNDDDDLDGMFNDGCPVVVGVDPNCDNMHDDDGDGYVNDGCPYCQRQDLYGGRWDFVYTQYGDASAIPVPADYGRVDGGVDLEHRADLAVKDGDTGMWAIDYADNGFGAWDRMLYNYGFASAIPVPADYDGDGRADLAIKTSAGQWMIDFASDQFGGWNCANIPAIYGDGTWIPVPGDYNGDGRADLAVKGVQSGIGRWKIDYSTGTCAGFGSFAVNRPGYGDATSVPVPFNYDPWRGPTTDMAIKASNGDWYIDYAYNGFLGWDTPCAMSGLCMSSPRPGYGGSWSQAVPGDYDGDGVVDLSVKDTNGYWYMDVGANGWYGWDYIPGTTQTSINNPARVIIDPARPYIDSTTIYGEGGVAVQELIVGVRYTIDVAVRAGWGDPDEGLQAAGVEINPVLEVPASLQIVGRTGTTYDPDFSDGGTVVEAHRRFAITCTESGNFPLGFQLRTLPPYFYASQVINPDYGIRVVCKAPTPATLTGNVRRRVRANGDIKYGVFFQGTAITNAHVEVFSEAGTLLGETWTGTAGTWSLPLTGGPFEVTVNAPGFSETVVVNLDVPASGLQLDTPLVPAFPLLPSGTTYQTYIDYSRGRTVFHTVSIDPSATAVRVGKAAYDILGFTSETGAQCNETPGTAQDDDGVFIDGTPFKDGYINDGCPSQPELAFPPAPEVGWQCANPYDDDGDGFVNDGCMQCVGLLFDKLWQMGDAVDAKVIMNATWWNTCNGNAVGYVYASQYVPSDVHCDNDDNPQPGCAGSNVYYAEGGTSPLYDSGAAPMFTVVGPSTNQQFDIVSTPAHFLEGAPSWNLVPHPIWDTSSPQDGTSDVDYAIQIPNPPLVRTETFGGVTLTRVIGEGDFEYDSHQNYDYAFARTAVGVGLDRVYWVVADGENVHGGNGATANQLGRFFRDQLGATAAVGLDSGLSTEMLIDTTAGFYRVNTITGEDAMIQINPYTETLVEILGAVGSVGYYMTVGP